MAEFKCEECDKTFSSEEAFKMHNDSKHFVAPKKQINKKKVKNRLIIVVVIILFSWGVFALFQSTSTCADIPAEQLNIGGHTNLALHIHSDIQVIIDEVPQIIPANIGVSSGIMRPIHTHDGNGNLHIEAPCQRDLTLGDFFKIWGEEFNKPGFNVVLEINGVSSPYLEDYVLKDKENVVLTYTPNNENESSETTNENLSETNTSS